VNTEIFPDDFVIGSREILDEVIGEAIATWSKTDVNAVENWKAFGRICPSEGECAAEWIKSKGFHVPFREYFVNPEKHDDLNPDSNILRAHRGPPTYAKYEQVDDTDLLLRSIRLPTGSYKAPHVPPTLNPRRTSKFSLFSQKFLIII
jgi:hypothetical protein